MSLSQSQNKPQKSVKYPYIFGDFASLQAHIEFLSKIAFKIAETIDTKFESQAYVSTFGLSILEEGDPRQRKLFIVIEIIDEVASVKCIRMDLIT